MKSRFVVLRSMAALALPVVAALLLGPAVATGVRADQHLSVKVSTDRGDNAVYNPGDPLEISARVSDGAYLLVYEIDAEGEVHVLYPFEHADAFVEGPATVRLPGGDSDYQLVVQGPVGEGYVVAIASREPFENLPWYLRPYDERAGELGYQGGADEDEEGVTAEGRIVGDPFVAMERIRRQVLAEPSAREGFATDYASYYVHEAVRYPRYLCNDCHRPGQWAWWDGFDPYYATCTAIDFRINASWWWGPSYWFGYVPYYTYVYRPSCPPRWRAGDWRNAWYSSWDGRRRWNSQWGGPLRRYKSPPPPGYVPPPSKFDRASRARDGRTFTPPGFLASAHGNYRTPPGVRGTRPNVRLGPAPDPGSRDDATLRQNRGRSGGITFFPRDRIRTGVGPGAESPIGRERTWNRPVRGSEWYPTRRSDTPTPSGGSPRYIERGSERPSITPRESAPAPRAESPRWTAPAPDRGGQSSSPPPAAHESPRQSERPAPSAPAPRGDGGPPRRQR